MSPRRHPDADYSNLSDALRFIIGQALADVHTALPGVVRAYDRDTRRATVQPAVRYREDSGREMSLPPLARVPVLFPSAGGMGLDLPLTADDPVLLVFSERGITEFKQTFRESSADPVGAHSLRDAVALPGFRPAGGAAAPARAGAAGGSFARGGNGFYLRGGGSREVGIQSAGRINIESNDTVRLRGRGSGSVEVNTQGGSFIVGGARSVSVSAGVSLTLSAPLIKLVAPTIQAKSRIITNPLLS